MMQSDGKIPSPLAGFSQIRRHVDHRSGESVANISPGELYVTRSPEQIVTVLGSCIAACIRDYKTGVGGMNHFMLPDSEASNGFGSLVEARYGNFAMEALINGILKHGGARNRLEIKLFGGARMIAGLSDVGKQNVEFVEAYLRAEQFSVESKDLGGDRARLVHYWPATGRVRVKWVRKNSKVATTENAYRDEISTADTGGSVELF